MHTVLTLRQVDNKTVGVHQDGEMFVATTLSRSSNPYKTYLGALKWLARMGYRNELIGMGLDPVPAKKK